ncbi:MAG TPA: hypothetical protein VGM56_26880 [Byssovorax sp.]|jgi:hypothetical protein
MVARRRKTRAPILFEIGPASSPKTVDTLAVLDLARAWFTLLVKVAREKNESFSLQGLDVKDKCTAVLSIPTSNVEALRAGKRAKRMIEGTLAIVEGGDVLVQTLRRAVHTQPEDQRPSVRIGKWEAPLRGPSRHVSNRPWSLSELRAVTVKVGGKKPVAHFRSGSEPAGFKATVTEEQARRLGAHLYGPVDIGMKYRRDAEGTIVEALIVEIAIVPANGEPVATLRRWFAESAADWSDERTALDR